MNGDPQVKKIFIRLGIVLAIIVLWVLRNFFIENLSDDEEKRKRNRNFPAYFSIFTREERRNLHFYNDIVTRSQHPILAFSYDSVCNVYVQKFSLNSPCSFWNSYQVIHKEVGVAGTSVGNGTIECILGNDSLIDKAFLIYDGNLIDSVSFGDTLFIMKLETAHFAVSEDNDEDNNLRMKAKSRSPKPEGDRKVRIVVALFKQSQELFFVMAIPGRQDPTLATLKKLFGIKE